MPFYHTKCGGDISILRRRCKKCGHKWSLWGIFFDSHIHPGTSYDRQAKKPKRTPTSYAKWADNLPAVATVAGRLPKWPRWARITVVFIIFAGILIGLYLLMGWKLAIPVVVVLVILAWRAYKRWRRNGSKGS